MLWAGFRARAGADAYLGTRSAALAMPGRKLLTASCDGFDHALAWVQARLAEHAENRRGLRVWLSGSVCPGYLLPVVEGCRSEAERRAVAEAWVQEQGDIGGQCELWIQASSLTDPAVVAALSTSYLHAIDEALSRQGRWGRRSVAVRPYWAECVRVAQTRRPVPACLAIQDCDSMTLLHFADGAYRAVQTVTQVSTGRAAAAALSRCLLELEIEPSVVARARLSFAEPLRPSVRSLPALAPLLRWAA